MTVKTKYYWDACAWISLIQRDPTRIDSLEYVLELAKNPSAEVEIWTSNFTLAEVFKRPCGGADQVGLSPDEDVSFEDFIIQDFVQRIEVTYEVGQLARRLLRAYPKLKKPQDAIHLASALLYDIDELHTYDGNDLLGLSGKIPRRDGKNLIICPAPTRPALPAPEPDLLSILEVEAETGSGHATVKGGAAHEGAVTEIPDKGLPLNENFEKSVQLKGDPATAVASPDESASVAGDNTDKPVASVKAETEEFVSTTQLEPPDAGKE